MGHAAGELRQDRVKAGVGVVALHVLLGYALVTGLGFDVGRTASENLKLIDISPEPLPPPMEESRPARAAAPKEEGAASPQSMRARPSPVVAPKPKIRLKVPPPLPTVEKKTAVPAGSATSAGVSNIPGPGSGTGGLGNGMGSGGQGSGNGGGGGASKAVRLRGSISNSDYPQSARLAKVGGSVSVLFTVEREGRVNGCRVVRSSGNADLDSTTCRLIEQRFVYKPATDAQGRAVQAVVRTTFTYNWVVPAPPPRRPGG
jgi:protein TonB